MQNRKTKAWRRKTLQPFSCSSRSISLLLEVVLHHLLTLIFFLPPSLSRPWPLSVFIGRRCLLAAVQCNFPAAQYICVPSALSHVHRRIRKRCRPACEQTVCHKHTVVSCYSVDQRYWWRLSRVPLQEVVVWQPAQSHRRVSHTEGGFEKGHDVQTG